VRDSNEKGYFWKFLECYFMFSYVYVYTGVPELGPQRKTEKSPTKNK
jgi:hypothetical protein